MKQQSYLLPSLAGRDWRRGFFFLLLMFCLSVLWSCSSDEEAPADYSLETVAGKPSWRVNLVGNDAAPAWMAPDPSNYESSMFIMVKLQEELIPYSSDDDRMTVFIGDECRALPSMRNADDDGHAFFVLKIRGNSTDRNVIFRLSYYCAQLHQVFTLQGKESFAAEITYGYDEDFVPDLLSGSSKYPVQGQLTVGLPESTPFVPESSDLVAVFAGDECRGAGSVGKPFTVFRTTAGEVLQLRYYSTQQSCIYSMKQPVGEETSMLLKF